MNLVSRVIMILWLSLGTLCLAWGQNDSIPDQEGFNEDAEVVDENGGIEPEEAEPTSTKERIDEKSPFRNRRFNPKYGLRRFLNKFSFTPALGYSKTFYREDVPNDTEALDFNGSGFPLSGTLNFHADRFRIGAGAGLEFHSIKDDQLAIDRGFINKKSTTFTKFYGNIGAEVYRYWDYILVPELQIGKLKLGKGFNSDSVSNGLFINLGVSIEKEMSEYFRFIAKPSYEFRNLDVTGASSSRYKMPAVSLMVGFSIRYPDLPRCPIRACHTQIKHVHFGNEYRGQPLPINQYRGYGELNKKLLKYRGRNKRKLNPY